MLNQAKKRIPFKWKYLAHQFACNSAGRVADLVLPPAKKVVILANARTGSNLLVSYLNQTPAVSAYGEIFGNYYIDDPYVLSKIRRVGAVRHLEDMVRRTSNERVVCVKLLYRDFQKRYQQIKKIPSMDDLLEYLKTHTDFYVVHLRRDNLLDVVISLELARRTGKFIGGEYEINQVEIAPDKCQQQFEIIKAAEEKYRSAFLGPRYLEVSYQELTTNAASALKKLEEFLDIGPIQARSHHTKQNTSRRREAIANYDELKAHFAGTAFERYFD